jgi:cytochrome c2
MRANPCWSGLLTALLLAGVPSIARAESEASGVFSRKCSSCHSFGKGDLVGPDLKGVTERRARPWLVSWILSSDRMIRAGDPAGVALFRKYKQQRMPDHDLTTPQIEALLDYLAAGGPEAEANAQARPAHMASTEEVELGEKLFYGKVTLAHGGVSCVSCHSVLKQRAAGSLGPDLTHAYSKYQDKGLASLLERACFPRLPAADGVSPVTANESFALKAFLHRADESREP